MTQDHKLLYIYLLGVISGGALVWAWISFTSALHALYLALRIKR